VEVTLSESDEEREEEIESLLWELGAPGFERRDDETWSELLEDPRPRSPGSVVWRVYDDTDETEMDAIARFVAALGDDVKVRSWRLNDMSFMTAWKQYFKPARVSERFMVHPPWDVPQVDAGTVLLSIDPGMAFGTGTHETTRLCLRALDRVLSRPGLSLLDVGTGSGILAIGAALLGAAPIVATDIDDASMAATRENAARNGVGDRISVSRRGLDEVEGTFDVVVANILFHILLDLRDGLRAHVATGGALLLSGVLGVQDEALLEAFEGEGFVVENIEHAGDWVCATMRRV
jgi:ribosomal protein L11 methyltransferase